MADLKITAIPSTAAVQGVQASPTLSNSAASLAANLTPGALISGFVLNRDARGNPVLRTESGDFVMESKYFLKIGSDVVVRLAAPGSPASILSVDGHTPREAENIPAHDTDADVIVRSGTARGNAPAPATGEAQAPARSAITFTGTLLRPDAGAQNAALTLNPGAQVLLRLVRAALPAAPVQAVEEATAITRPPLSQATAQTQVPAQAALPPAQAAVQQTGAQAQAPPATANAAPPGNAPLADAPEVQPTQAASYGAYARADAATPGTPPPSQAPALAGSQMMGQIISEGDTQAPLVQTPLGLFRLNGAPALPNGSMLTLQVLEQGAANAAAPARPATLAELAGGWQSLQALVEALTQADEQAATQLLRSVVPASAYGAQPAMNNLYPTPQNMSSGLFAFIKLLTGGSMRHMLGERATAALTQAGHTGLIDKADAELATLREAAAPAPSAHWQALFVPMMMEGEIKPLRIYTKRDRRGKAGDKPNAEGDTRFVVELELSQTGPLQLDGLVRKNTGKDTHFDLVIRSHAALDKQAQSDIQAIYSGIGEATGYKGVVLFQDMPEFPVNPLEEIIGDRHRDVMA